MPFNSEKRSSEAQKRPRDKNGHFIPLKPKVKVTGQANILADLIKTQDGDGRDSSWMTLTINHPFRKIIEILQQIKDKQSTKVNLSFTIPLVALPIVILLAFQFGRYQSSCSEFFASQPGTLKSITVERSLPPDNWFLKALTYLPFVGDTYNRKEQFKQPVLEKSDNETIIVNNEVSTGLDAFIESKVIIFGNYNSCTKTLNLNSPQNISNY